MYGAIEFGLLVLLAAWSAVTTYGWLSAMLVNIFVFNLAFIWSCYVQWDEDFGIRYQRSNPRCPSNKLRPVPKRFSTVHAALSMAASLTRRGSLYASAKKVKSDEASSMKRKKGARAAPPRNDTVHGRLAKMDVSGALRRASGAVWMTLVDYEDPDSGQSDESDDGIAVPHLQPDAEGSNSREDFWKDFKNAHKNPDNAKLPGPLKRTHNVMPYPVRKSLESGQSGINVCPFEPTRASSAGDISTARLAFAPGFTTGGALVTHGQKAQKEWSKVRGAVAMGVMREALTPWEADSKKIAEKQSVPIGQRLDDAEDHRKHRGDAISHFEKKGELSNQLATSLEMDHIFIPFSTYVWGVYFVGMNAAALWICGISKMCSRLVLIRWGVLDPPKCNHAAIGARLLLESIGLMVHYTHQRTVNGKATALFTFLDIPLLNAKGAKFVAKVFTVDVCLENREIVEAKLNDKELSAADACTIIWFQTITASHVKLHAYGNWGVNVEGENVDSFTRRNGAVTVMYNYFGFSVFKRLTTLWANLGVFSDHTPGLPDVFQAGVDAGVPSHAKLHELMPHSETVKFVVKLRNHFLNEFEEHKFDFPGIDGEAMFIGTVLHSLDHTLMAWNLDDPLMLRADNPEFRAMVEIGMVVRAGFVDDLPGLYFNKRYKAVRQPFFKNVYAHAAKINKRFADHMDTCIVK